MSRAGVQEMTTAGGVQVEVIFLFSGCSTGITNQAKFSTPLFMLREFWVYSNCTVVSRRSRYPARWWGYYIYLRRKFSVFL